MKKIKLNYLVYTIAVILSIILIFVMLHNNTQAMEAEPLRVTFQGEYSIQGGEWKKITKETDFPANNGDLHLKGYFQIETEEGDLVEKAPKDLSVIAHFNHIGGEYIVDNQSVPFDMENKLLGNCSCGDNWVDFFTPEENAKVEIILHNPHKVGNSNAFNTFMNSMHAHMWTTFDKKMLESGKTQRYTGIGIIVFSFIIIGVAIFSTYLKVPNSIILWLFGLMIFIGGTFFILDSPGFSFAGNTVVFNTTTKQLCILLFPLFLFGISANFLHKKFQKTGKIILLIYGIASVTAIILALTGKFLLYDINYYMLILQLIASVFLVVLSLINLKNAKLLNKVLNIICIFPLIALSVDIIGVNLHLWDTALISKIVFSVIFIAAIIYSLKIIPSNIKSAIHEKELQLELQENKISVMLSQIQPHFLFNALSSICGLCESEPLKARDALIDFSTYLRENMDSLNNKDTIPFEKELSHIKTYLKLEKMRFDDRLNVIYDINYTDFRIQPLTIQPIVENAVKHGICSKEDGGTVTLKTYEENGIVTIIISDDGIGFDADSIKSNNNSRLHIGLENVRLRVKNLPMGNFIIKSEKNKGTEITISFKTF